MVHSTKSAVIIRRSSISSGGNVFHVLEGRSIPDWKKFLFSPENKQCLVRCLGDYALKHYNELALQDHSEIFMAEYFQSPETVKQFCAGTVADCTQLLSTHAEADTIIILHSLFANELMLNRNSSSGRIVIKSSDIDI